MDAAALDATMSPDDPKLSLLACAERPSGRPAPPRHPGGVPRAESRLEPGGIGDIDTLTVREYLALGWRSRLRYRLYRHPIIMFGLGPTYMFLLQHRAPVGLMRGAGWTPWASTMSTNVGIAAIAGSLMWLIGPLHFLMIHGPIFLLAASMGVW